MHGAALCTAYGDDMKNKAFDKSKYPLWIDPNAVTPYERNAKIHTEKQINNICTSIRRFGWQQDTVLTTDNVLVIGHGRRLAAIELGCEMPYHVIDKTADELTDEDIRELRIADNQTNAETGLDMDVLDLEIGDLDFEGFDFEFGIVTDDGYGTAFNLADGDRLPVQNMTFTFSDDEAEIVKAAIAEMKADAAFERYDNPMNENSNGRALFLVVSEWQARRT